MTLKGVVRYVIAAAIIWILLLFLLPAIGIPRSQMIPPPFAYNGAATKTAEAYITGKQSLPSSNIFHSIDTAYLVNYQFRAPSLPALGNKPPATPTTIYKGQVSVTQAWYESVKKGDTVSVRYDPTDPEISGIPANGAGRNSIGGSSLFSMWIVWWIVTLALGYMLAPWLERLFLRESY